MSRRFSFSRIVLICIALLLLATTLVSRASAAATEVVVTDQSSDWAFLEEIPNGSGSFVVGPATPPVGIGSAQLEVDATGREILVSAFQVGTPLADFTSLSYSAYRSSGDATSTPSLQINVDYDSTDLDFGWQGRLVYEPYLNGSLPDDTWTDWDTLSGNWWASGAPGNTQCPQNSPCTWAEVLTHFPNASVHGTLGAILFKVGGPWAAGFVGNVDNLLVGVSGAETLYNFEPARCINTTASTGHGTIQDAVDSASAGDTIECEAGTYVENVTIDKAITLSGAGDGSDALTNSILDGSSLTGNGITLANNVEDITIEEFRIVDFGGTAQSSGIRGSGNNNLTIQNVTTNGNGPGYISASGGIYLNGPINNVLIDNVTAHNNQGRGIVIWNGFKTNITITNSDVQNNNCCGIELQDGTSSGVTITGNTIANNSDSGMSVLGMKAGAGANLIANNTITDNGRFGMEIKNPDGNGATSGDGSIVIEDNNVSFTASPSMNNRDHGGIVVIRRDFLPGNTSGYPDVPTGVVVRNNTVSGYTHQNQVGAPTESEGFGIVVEGTNHTVTGNTLNNNMVAIQEQGGNHPNGNYVPDDAGSGSQNPGDSDSYFGRGNAPVACGNTIGPNTFSGNSIDFRENVAGSGGVVTNTDTGEIFCSIQSAIDDSDTLAGHTLTVGAGTYVESVVVNKDDLQILGPNTGIDPNTGVRGAEAIIVPSPSAITTTVTIEAGGILFDGFTIDGDNPDVVTGVTANGADPDSDYIVDAMNMDPLTFSNNIVKNGRVFGFSGYTGTDVSSGNQITNNLFDNFSLVTYGYGGRAIVPLWNYYADVVDNVVTNSLIGIYTENNHKASADPTVEWKNNDVSAERAGIWYNLAYGTATPLTIKDNTVSAETAVVATRWDAVWLTSIGSDLDPVISGNVIDGSGTTATSVGYNIWNDTTVAPNGIEIEDGSVDSVDYGVWINNFDGYPTSGSPAGPSAATVSNVDMADIGIAAFFAKDNPSDPDRSPVALTAIGVSIENSGSATAVKVEGAAAQVTFKGSNVDDVDTVFDVADGSLLAYANNLTNFTTGVSTSSPTAFNAGHNWWGAFSPQQPGVDNDSWEWRLGAKVEDWADGTGSASLNDSVEGTASLTGSGMTVIVSHGRASTPAEAPFGKAISAEIGPNQCSDFYDMFVVGASSGTYDVVLPVATGTCQTIANATPAIEQFALTGSGAPDADACSPDEACWNDVSASYSAGTLMATVPASAVKGTPFTTPSSNGNDPTAIGLQGLGATGAQQPLVAISAVVALLALFSIGLLLNKRQRVL